jgi:hypothetical protein
MYVIICPTLRDVVGQVLEVAVKGASISTFVLAIKAIGSM